MQTQLSQLEEFSKAFNTFMQKIPNKEIPENIKQLRITLMSEELKEVIKAMETEDLSSISKELADLLYVLLGTVHAYGLGEKFEEIFDEVHKSNMSKLDDNGKPIYREDGKVEKSKNYREPDIQKILNPKL